MKMSYSEAIQQLIDWGKLGPRRDEFIVDAHDSGVPKSEIAKLLDISWQSVDRVVRGAGRTPNEGEN